MSTANAFAKSEQPRVVLSPDQIQKRVREMAHQISDDYRGRTIHALGILENGFIFMADLVRALDVPVICQFIKPRYRLQASGPGEAMEIFFSHDADVRGQHLLLIEGLVHSGVTSEFLMSDLQARQAASVKLATLLDRQSARRVQVQPDYFGFLVDDAFLIGYGLGSPEQTNRNLPYIGSGS
jgi:hypoxanthine phosphoribosyltransferase